jgi:hypothetical protein
LEKEQYQHGMLERKRHAEHVRLERQRREDAMWSRYFGHDFQADPSLRNSFGLPCEIRDMIYKLAFKDSNPDTRH